MTDILRQEIATGATTIVLKIGTHVLTDARGRLVESRIQGLAGQVNRAIESGRRVLLVSSGAVGAGMGRMGLSERPTDLSHLQALAAIGQAALVENYHRCFATHGHTAAQVLITADVLQERFSYLNARNTLLRLLEYGAIPIINENDTVAVEELRATFGDNDQLAAIVANLVQSPLLVLLSNVDGLYDGDPSHPESTRLSTVERFDDSVLSMAKDSAGGLSKGGMASKLRAARQAVRAGGNVILASGEQEDVLDQILAGKPIGTLFLAENANVAARKRWIGFAVQPKGTLVIDDGARRAIQEDGRSLLAVGVIKVDGEFRKGDVIRIHTPDGQEIGRGLTNYGADEIRRIRGLRTDKILQVLGHFPYEEVLHRDNMVVM